MVERLAVNQWVVGSNPTAGANKNNRYFRRLFLLAPELKLNQTFEIILPNI